MLKYKLKIFLGWLIVLYLAIMSVGCGFNPLVIAAGEVTTNTSRVSNDIPIANLPSDYEVLDTVINVGRSLGYRLVLKKEDSIGLHYDTSVITEVATGVIRTADVMVEKGKDRLYIDIAVSGDFGTGRQHYADKLLVEFRETLLEKLAEVSKPQHFVQH